MRRNFNVGLTTLLASSLALVLTACSGTDGAQGPVGPQGPPGPSGEPLTAETCIVCHSAGQLADEKVLHDTLATTSLAKGSIVISTADFTPSAGGNIIPTITFQVFDSKGVAVTDPANTALNGGWGAFNLTVAKLIPATATVPEHWQNFINGTATPYNPSREAGGNKLTKTANSVLTYTAATSTYSYKYAVDLANVTTPIAVPLAAGDTVRFGIQITNYTTGTPVYDMANGTGDFTVTAAAGTLLPRQRDIVTTAACNACHGKLAIHGRRVEANYCTTCHNYALSTAPTAPGTPGGNSGDLTVYIHQIHGAQIVSATNLLAGIVPQEITYPQDIRNCATCHAGTDGSVWNTNPSRYACSSCHDTVSFVSPAPTGMTLHSGGAQVNDSSCSGCHPAASIIGYHAIPEMEAAKKFAYIITATNSTGPGLFPVVTFKVIDPTSTGCVPATGVGCATYDVKNDAAFKNGARLNVDIGFSNSDIQNVGTNAISGGPISINAISASVPTANANEFAVTSTIAVPVGATGSGTAAIEGHPMVPGAATNTFISPAVISVSKAFAITGTTATARRTIVDINKCNACHVRLVLHGGNRVGDVNTCALCHNTEATDATVRTDATGAPLAASATLDGKVSEGIDFKYMIHGIHAKNIVVYGYKYSPTIPPNPVDYRDVTYPNFLWNCQACHTSTGYAGPGAAANATTTEDGADKVGNADNLRTTKWKATCGQCHTGAAGTHIIQNGGASGYTQSEINAVQ